MIEPAGRRARVVCSSLALACLAAVAAGEEPPVTAFSEQVEVRIVEIDVAVRDRDGRHVAGLSPEDFRLTVDGRETAIDYFSERRGESRAEPASTEAAASPIGSTSSPTASPLNLLVYVDEEFSLPIDLERVLLSFEEQLDRLAPGDRVAIVAWDGRRLDRLLDWTPPGPALAEALARTRRRPAWGLRAQVDLASRGAPASWVASDRLRRGSGAGRSLLDARESACDGDVDLEASGCGSASVGRVDLEAIPEVREVRNRIERTARAAAAAVRSFARPAGRRAIVLLAGGWPLPAPAPPGVASHPFGWTGVPGLRVFDPLLDVADHLGYTIYPVDVPGMVTAFGADVERGGLGVTGPGFASLSSIPSFSEAPYHGTLRYLAERTGGVAHVNASRRMALAAIAADARDSYSIAFTAPRERDDRAHRIAVAVARPGVDVRTRRAYRDLSDSTELGYRLEAALLDGSGAETGTALTASAGAAIRDGAFRMRLPLLVEVPRRALAGEGAGESGGPMLADLRVAAVDRDGRRTLVGPVSVELQPTADDPDVVAVEVPLTLRRVDQELAVSLFEPASGTHLVTGLRLAR